MFAATVFVSLLAVVSAVPTAPQGQVCGSGNTVQCCDSATAHKVTQGGLLGLDLENLLGQCNDVTATVIGAGIPIKNVCSSQAVCCSNTNQVGLVNVGCTPIMV